MSSKLQSYSVCTQMYSELYYIHVLSSLLYGELYMSLSSVFEANVQLLFVIVNSI